VTIQYDHLEQKRTIRTSLTAPWLIVWVALTVRIAYVVLAHMYRIRPYGDHFGFGWEMGRIAKALVTGYGYADPFNGHTGPTAWITPFYPLLIAAVFKLFGIYTPLSAFVLLTINCIFSALMVRTTWEIAARCFSSKVAVWSAWIWALYPAAMQYAVKWIWEMTLTAFLFSWVLVLALRMRNTGGPPEEASVTATPRRWAMFGLLWGLIALSNPSLLLFLPVCGLWILSGTPQWQQHIGNVILAASITILCIAPWTYRNWIVFHQFVPMRGNFGAELYLGNGPGAVGLLMEYDHPAQAPDQLRLYRQMGEIAYSKARENAAKTIIRQDPKRFAMLCFKRLYYFWFSVPHPSEGGPVIEYGRNLNYQFASITGLLGLWLALRRKIPGAILFAWAFALLPFMYYFVTVHARFRHPLEPLIDIFTVFLFQSATRRKPVKN